MEDNQHKAPLQLALLGAPGDTLNLGVAALNRACVDGLFSREPDARLTVFDNGLGRRSTTETVGSEAVTYWRVGMRRSRRYHRRESLWNIELSSRLGGLWNPAARALGSANAVLAVSGGDSFSDIYGQARFDTIARPQELVLARGGRLVLLPQTFGPYGDARNLARAREIVRSSAMAVARDPRSFEALVELAGDDFDPGRYLSGVDMAFAMPSVCPRPDVAAEWSRILQGRRLLVGVNVSGLVYNDKAAGDRYGLQARYREVVRDLIGRLVYESDASVVLVPHVLAPRGVVESDLAACEAVAGSFDLPADRILLGPVLADPREVKWMISQCDWFCGTRMHSTIAALSSGVPTAALAYSGKTEGVFETCGMGDQVADLRRLDSHGALDRVWSSWTARDRLRDRLAEALPGVLQSAADQMDLVVGRSRGQ